MGSFWLFVLAAGRVVQVQELAPGVRPAPAPALATGLRGTAPARSAPPAMGAYSVPPVTREDFLRAGNRMYPERILHLGQEIDDGVINQIIATMLFMDAEEEKRQTLYINSPGGSVIAGLALYDTMQHVKSPVATVNLGMAASMASFLLGAGERGNRLALPDSRVMIHQPMGGTEGDAVAADPRVEADQVMHIKDTILTLYADMTGKTRADLERDLSYDNYMSSQDAMKYGLVDRIVEG